jgi:hypothetical protein
MSIVRIGLGETKNFAEGYEAIFGKKEKPAEKADEKPAAEESKAEAKPKKAKKK